MRTSTIRLVGRKLPKFSFPRPTSAPSFNVITNHLPHASRELPKLTSVESTEERTSKRASVSAEESGAHPRWRKKERKPRQLLAHLLCSSFFFRFFPRKLHRKATKSWSYSPRIRTDEKLTSRRHLIIYLGQRDRGRNWPDFLSMRSRWSPRDGADEETWLYRLLHTGSAAAGPIRGSAIRVRFPFSLRLWYSPTLPSTVSILASKIWSLDALLFLSAAHAQGLESVFA